MPRTRMLGVLIIGLAPLVTAVLPRLSVRSIPGTAVAGPVPGQPAVGDCVLYSGSSPWNLQDAAAAPTGTSSSPYPMLQMGTCTGSRYGEVVGVIADPARSSPS